MATFQELLAQGQPQAPATSPGLNFLEGLGRSYTSSFAELIGIAASPEVEQFRAEHPVAGFATQFAGLLTPYAGYARATSRLTPFMRLVDRAGDAAGESAFLGGVAREVVRFAPLEAARTGGAFFAGETVADLLDRPFQGTGEVLTEAAFNLGVGGVLGGTVGALTGAGPKLAERGVQTGIDLFSSPQKQVQKLEEMIAAGNQGPNGELPSMLARARRRVLAQDILRAKGQRYIYEVEGLDKAQLRRLNRLFTPRATGRMERSKFVVSTTGKSRFGSAEELRSGLEAAGIAGQEGFIQFPRIVKPLNRTGQKFYNQATLEGLQTIDSAQGWRFAYDKGDNLYVMARQLPNGDNLLFKTSDPGRFVPDTKQFADIAKSRAAAFDPVAQAVKPLDGGLGTRVYDTIASFRQQPLIDTRGMDPRKGVGQATYDKLAKATGLDQITDSHALVGVKRFLRSTLAPAMFQFRHSPLAGHIAAATRLSKEAAEEVAERLYLGQRLGTSAKTPLGTIMGASQKRPSGESLDSLIDDLFRDGDEVAKFRQAVIETMSPEQAVADLGLGEAGERLLKELGRVDEIQTAGLTAVQQETGNAILQPKPFHYMLSRFWNGDWRVPIFEGRKVIGYAAGKKRAQAMGRAQAMVDEGLEEGMELRVGAPHLSKSIDDEVKMLAGLSEQDAQNFGKLMQRVRIRKTQPRTVTRRRKGTRGFEGDVAGDEWTKQFVKEHVLGQLRNYQQLQARLGMEHVYSRELQRLARQDPATAEELAKRIAATFGQQGPVTKVVNDTVDKVMSPWLGANSATKITSGMNQAMFHLTFGFYNTGFNLANMLTFVQTAYPQLSFISTAAPSRVASYYTYYPVEGIRSANGLGVLDMFKMTGRSFARMGAGSDATLMKHVQRAASEGVTSPRFVEEWVGQGSPGVRNIKEAIKGGEPFSEVLKMASKGMPTLTEKFSRTHAFVLGDTFFKDVLGVADDELRYQLSKQFVEKTMFLYGTEDRATLMTGPLGGAMGLFKNWTMHYLGWMLEYAGEAAKRGNWNPLAWSVGGTVSLGGVAAAPFYGAANAMSNWMSDKSVMQHTYEMFGGEDVSDAVYYGLPAFLGFTVQGQVAAPFADPGEDAARMFSLVYWDRLRYAKKAMGQAIDFSSATGNSPINDPRTRDLFLRAFAPKSIYRTAQALQSETLDSISTGLPVMEWGSASRALYALGLNSIEVSKNYEVADALWKDQTKMREAVTSFGEQLAQSWEEKDMRASRVILQRATAQGVDLSRVVKSAKTRLAKGFETQIERQFEPMAALKYKQSGILD